MSPRNKYPNLYIVNHPLVQHKLTHMRRKDTPSSMFRQLLYEIGLLIGYEATRDLPLQNIIVETPLASISAPIIARRNVGVVSVLRAGLGMASSLMKLMPTACEGHIGLYREPQTKQPVEYMVKLPCVEDRLFFLVDPMLATGNSAVHAVDTLLKYGVERKNIRFLALVVAPEGMTTFNERYADIPIFAAALDACLDEQAYIVPGLGDAGDRLFGTK